MNRYLDNIRETIKKNKKKLIRKISILISSVAIIGVAGVIAVYSIAKSNINYTLDEAKEIALQTVEGEVLGVKKKLELDMLGFEYEFKIKDSNNMLIEVTVDSNLGAIIDLDNYYD
ncbi:MAG: PepSY domain-containing protein [Clostridium sp.]|uniref:PepSY domain-containing protein n=1 Tax=Clostridium sp. TaxID=1506 RepID=UPI0025C042DF|nr:PepSY domain-containing protein [Clostridium sp.]MBS4958778.1 PepSY domain-containing protein [Clostridium sp.]